MIRNARARLLRPNRDLSPVEEHRILLYLKSDEASLRQAALRFRRPRAFLSDLARKHGLDGKFDYHGRNREML